MLGFTSQSEINRAKTLLYGTDQPFEELQRESATTSSLVVDAVTSRAEDVKRDVRFISQLSMTVKLRLVAELIVGIGLMVFVHPGAGILTLLMWFSEWQKVQNVKLKRALSFEQDYPAFLLALASGVRTGLDPLVAMLRSVELFPVKSEIRRELELCRERIERGDQEDQVIFRFGENVNHPDVRLFRTAFVLARREGSSLSEALQRLTKVTRQRQSFRRKIRSAVALQKMSAIGIGMCAVLIGGIHATANPELIKTTLNHPDGPKLLTIGAVLIVGGLIWMMRMSKGKV